MPSCTETIAYKHLVKYLTSKVPLTPYQLEQARSDLWDLYGAGYYMGQKDIYAKIGEAFLSGTLPELLKAAAKISRS